MNPEQPKCLGSHGCSPSPVGTSQGVRDGGGAGWSRERCWGTWQHKHVSPPWGLQTSCQPGSPGLPSPRAASSASSSARGCVRAIWARGGSGGATRAACQRRTEAASSVSTGTAAQPLPGRRGPSPRLALPVQTDLGTASEPLKTSPSQPAGRRSFIILEQAGGRASCLQPVPFARPVPDSSAAWRGAGIRVRAPGPSKGHFPILGELGQHAPAESCVAPAARH